MYRYLICFLLLLFPVFIHAQPRGFYLGAEVMPGLTYSPGTYFPNADNGSGAGIYGGYMADRTIGVYTGFYYRNYNFIALRDASGAQKLSYLEVPVALNLNAGKNSRKRFFIHIGAAAAFLMGAQYSGDISRQPNPLPAGDDRSIFHAVLIRPFLDYGFNFVSRNRATSILFGWHFSVAGGNAYKDDWNRQGRNYANSLPVVGLKLGVSYSFPSRHVSTLKEQKARPSKIYRNLPDNYQ